MIVNRVTDDLQTAYFYLQGLGRTSKTFLYKTLYYHFYSQEKKVLCVAFTRITGLLLPNRRTSHS
jgi:hypothetical protein